MRFEKLGRALDAVDSKVAELRKRFEARTGEATRLKMEVEKEEETIQAAENLVGKLKGEYDRWSHQVSNLNDKISLLPRQSLLAAAFLTYLCKAPKDESLLDGQLGRPSGTGEL